MAEIRVFGLETLNVLGGIDSATWRVYEGDVDGNIIQPEVVLWESVDNYSQLDRVIPTLMKDGDYFEPSQEHPAIATVVYKENGEEYPMIVVGICPYYGLPKPLPYLYRDVPIAE